MGIEGPILNCGSCLLTEVHRRAICEISAGSVAEDSTGYSDSSFVRWYDVRTDSVKTKRGWVKLHSIVDIRTRQILWFPDDQGHDMPTNVCEFSNPFNVSDIRHEKGVIISRTRPSICKVLIIVSVWC